jgi:hypothetical protein
VQEETANFASLPNVNNNKQFHHVNTWTKNGRFCQRSFAPFMADLLSESN